MNENHNPVILIRADGNENLGMGHLMRCMSIATVLEKEDAKCVFLVAQEQAGVYVKEKGFACEVLDTDYRNMEEEFPLLELLAKKYLPKCWLVDSYQITQEYLSVLREAAPVFYMDDTGENVYQADGLINYNIYGQDLDYGIKCPADMRLLLGADYVPIKGEFLSVEYGVRDKVRNVLITMGGSDKLNIAEALCRCLLNSLPEEVCFTVICGRFNSHLKELIRLQSQEPRIKVLVDVSDMWNQMMEADIAVSAAGSTMYELSAMGVPAVCCYYVENQRRIAEGFASLIGMTNAGDYSQYPNETLSIITDAVCKLADSKEERESLSSRMKQIVDGRGAKRIAQELCKDAICQHR